MIKDSILTKSPTSRTDKDRIVIGLVNNMPDTALRTTERQFSELLAAAGGDTIELKIYALQDVPRSDTAKAYISEHYEQIDALLDRRIDGLIVTGTSPRAPNLADEPYWASFTKLIDWADENTESTVWSCLAAHAAVLHLDGVARQPFREKLSGVFVAKAAMPHALTAGFPARWYVPQSRYNDLPQAPLEASGYRVLSRSSRIGVDMFVKQYRSLFVFLQGHPEYDPGALMREYRRDVTNFLNGERDAYPAMPRNYFDADARAALEAFRRRAESDRAPDLLAGLPIGKEERLAHRWRSPAVRVYRNWLAYLAERKAFRAGASRGAAGHAAHVERPTPALQHSR